MANHQTEYEAALRSGDSDKIFYHLVHHPTMPLTDAELAQLVSLHPKRWARFADYVGLLDGQAADRKLALLSGLERQLA